MDFIENCIFLYHVIIASEKLLEVAAEQSTGDLRAYFKGHLEEERGHAQWLAEDLESVDIDVKRTKIPVEAVEMVGSVYYFILHVNPVALLGYMRVLEGSPIAEEDLRRLELEYPQTLLRTLKHHALHDRNHAREIEEIISTLNPDQLALVQQIERRTRGYFERVVRN